MSPSVVLDTNVVVSAHLNEDGNEAAVFVLALAGKLRLFLSDPIFAEYKEVLSRPKFGLPSRQIERSLKLLRAASHLVTPTQTLLVSSDPADNKFLDCAQTAQADYLVTGNRRHFPKIWGKTRVVNAKELIKAIAADLKK